MKFPQGKIRIAIAGVGNCASSLIQGIYYYLHHPEDETGLTYRKLAGIDVSDIEIVAAFDVDERKIGKPLNQAIFAQPNVTTIFESNIDNKILVSPAPVLDGVAKHMRDYPEDRSFRPAPGLETINQQDVVHVLEEAKCDFLICYLPVGSENAVHFYANCALEAGVSFINAMPVFVASNELWIDRFAKRGLLIIGDDIKSQAGSTILHRELVHILLSRGITLKDTSQLNVGGNTDFLNMLDSSRVTTKRESKVESVRSQCQGKSVDIHAGPADYIPHLRDNKIAYINLRGLGFGNQPVSIDLKLSVEDSPNSAGVMIDVIRIAFVEKQKGTVGTVGWLNSYGFKHPLEQKTDEELRSTLQKWIEANDK